MPEGPTFIGSVIYAVGLADRMLHTTSTSLSVSANMSQRTGENEQANMGHGFLCSRSLAPLQVSGLSSAPSVLRNLTAPTTSDPLLSPPSRRPSSRIFRRPLIVTRSRVRETRLLPTSSAALQLPGRVSHFGTVPLRTHRHFRGVPSFVIGKPGGKGGHYSFLSFHLPNLLSFLFLTARLMTASQCTADHLLVTRTIELCRSFGTESLYRTFCICHTNK